jgi:hypothetical protein
MLQEIDGEMSIGGGMEDTTPPRPLAAVVPTKQMDKTKLTEELSSLYSQVGSMMNTCSCT